MLALLEETAGLALDLLEKNGVLVPFCKVRTLDQKSMFICSGDHGEETFSDDDPQRCADSILAELKRRIALGDVLQFAFCADRIMKFQGDPVEQRMLAIEFQNDTEETGVYYFPLAVENGKASLGSYKVADVKEKLL
jgi:hypothetical protein